jgi:hypothetical protein
MWSEIKKWAKNIGYDAVKNKTDGQYHWTKISNPNICGICKSVSKLATAIFNDRTNNKWVEHQIEYAKNKKNKTV